MSSSEPAFARDPATAAYYDQRAAEYDEWYLGQGHFAERDRPDWDAELARLLDWLATLPAAGTLDAACGSGFLTRHLPGRVVALDLSPAMAALTATRLTDGLIVVGDALRLPFAEGSFERVFAGHFYGHLPPDERETFLAEAARVANELIVVDTALRDDTEPEQWQERTLNDGSRHRVFKRYLAADQIADEIGGGEATLTGRWFVAARADLRGRQAVGRSPRIRAT